MSLKVNTTLTIQSDSDNSFPDDLKMTRDGDSLEIRMDMRTIEVSYKQMKQVMKVFDMAEEG